MVFEIAILKASKKYIKETPNSNIGKNATTYFSSRFRLWGIIYEVCELFMILNH
jgi:hypothetical protein